MAPGACSLGPSPDWSSPFLGPQQVGRMPVLELNIIQRAGTRHRISGRKFRRRVAAGLAPASRTLADSNAKPLRASATTAGARAMTAVRVNPTVIRDVVIDTSPFSNDTVFTQRCLMPAQLFKLLAASGRSVKRARIWLAVSWTPQRHPHGIRRPDARPRPRNPSRISSANNCLLTYNRNCPILDRDCDERAHLHYRRL